MDEPVLRSLDDCGTLLLTLNRPERNNAWTLAMEEAYFEALGDASADPMVRVIVVTGAGKAFCPGMDIDVLAEMASGGEDPSALPRVPMTSAVRVPKPVIAAVNGACAGIGLIQALCADVRFASSNAKFSTSFARRGLPAENGTSWLLPRLVGTGTAMDLLLSARVVLADEAHEVGLVQRLFEPRELLPAVLRYANDIAVNCSPAALAAIKCQVLADADLPLEESRRAALRLLRESRNEADFAEGIASYRERRPPRFAGISAPIDLPRELFGEPV